MSLYSNLRCNLKKYQFRWNQHVQGRPLAPRCATVAFFKQSPFIENSSVAVILHCSTGGRRCLSLLCAIDCCVPGLLRYKSLRSAAGPSRASNGLMYLLNLPSASTRQQIRDDMAQGSVPSLLGLHASKSLVMDLSTSHSRGKEKSNSVWNAAFAS